MVNRKPEKCPVESQALEGTGCVHFFFTVKDSHCDLPRFARDFP